MTKLTKQQIAVLASADTQPDGFAIRSADLKSSAATRVAAKLIEQGLVRELLSKGDAPVWREDEKGKCFSLKILKAGRTAVQAMAQTSAEDEGSAPRSDVVTAGRHAAPANGQGARQKVAIEQARSPSSKETIEPDKRKTKRALVLDLLGRDGGATLEELIAATGWLPHTTRAALTGLRKSGFAIDRQRSEAGGTSSYRIAAAPPAAAA